MSDLGNREIFAQNLNWYLAEAGKERSEVCEALKINYSTMTEWLNARKYPRIDKIELLANYFGIRKSDLIERRNMVERGDMPDLRAAFLSLSPDKQAQALDYLRYLVESEKRGI
jgi:transcriptional regulator with XRE-family HTH domain